jgi:hypothetical protein
MTAMRIRQVLEEFEAHLHAVPPGAGGMTGKSEWKQYGNGTFRFKVSLRNIALPDNSQIELVLDDLQVRQLTVSGGKAKLDLESQIQVEIPGVKAGQRLQVRFGNTVLAEGIYVEE